MRLIFIFLVSTFVSANLFAQEYFPIKQNKKWGLMDTEGNIIQQPVYDAIGEFKQFGYAVMQRNGKVGMLGHGGTEVILPKYEDLKVLDSTMIAVMDNDEWMVINLNGDLVLQKGYERLNVWKGGYLAFMKNGLWGIVDYTGKNICDPVYEKIEPYGNGYFVTFDEKKKGLLSADGQVILQPQCDEVRIYNENLFFYKNKHLWGAVNRGGQHVLEPNFETFKNISPNFLKLSSKNRSYLYSITSEKIISEDHFDEFYPFSPQYILCKKDRQLGLMDVNGYLALSVQYNEIQVFAENQFRVKVNNKWGVVATNNELIVPFDFDFIAPLKGRNCVVKLDSRFGVANYEGNVVIPIEFDKIELEVEQAKAFKGEALSLFYFDEEGLLKEENSFKKHYTITIGKKRGVRRIPNRIGLPENDYTLSKFEWFYSSEDDKWGLRRLDDGTEQIKPSFDFIQVERNFGFTIVGIEQFGYYQFERTNYRFHMSYGMVNNEVGLLVTEVNMWDIRLSDFEEGHLSARVVFNNGRHGLVSRNPVGLMLKKDCAFIGDFHDGVARASIKGRLSGSFKNKTYGLGNLSDYLDKMLTKNELVDYTLYDKEFQHDADIICEGCEWGYIDTSGFMSVQPQFTFAQDFVNEVGIVKYEDKWGLVDANDRLLIPFNYDGIHFLENTDNKILRVYNNEKKYGLIDTLGRVAVNLRYDELGGFSEGRLAVKRNGMWGYVNEEGFEVIPCRFKFVKNFHDNVAVVKLGNKWGVIDKQGDVVINFQYTRLGNFRNGKAWAYTPKGVGYIDIQNNFVIDPKFDKAFDFDNGVARVVKDGKFGLIDEAGKYILTPQFSFISEFDENHLAVVQIGNSRIRYKLINRIGHIVIPKAFKKIEPFSEGMAAVKYKDHYGFINTNGKLVVPAIYSKVSAFKEGRAAVQKEGLCGYINDEGEEVVTLEFSKCLDFEDGKAVVYKGYKKGGLIDLDGNFIIEPSINRLYDFSDGRGLVRDENYQFYYITQQAKMYDGLYQKAGGFQHGIAVVQSTNNGMWGIVNQKGIEIIAPKYDKIEKFKDGYARVRIKSFSGLTNLQGDLIVHPDYEYISYAGRGLFRVEQGDKIGYFDTKGNWVWGLSD